MPQVFQRCAYGHAEIASSKRAWQTEEKGMTCVVKGLRFLLKKG